MYIHIYIYVYCTYVVYKMYIYIYFSMDFRLNSFDHGSVKASRDGRAPQRLREPGKYRGHKPRRYVRRSTCMYVYIHICRDIWI